MDQQDLFEAVVIGSGFGGAVAACRLAAKWPDRVLVLERGRRYYKGSFARDPHDFANNFWSAETGGKSQKRNGLFDIRHFTHMDSVVAAGYGGGSLIYANVFKPAPDWVFSRGWPQGLTPATLAPYYQVARRVLGAKVIPPAQGDPRRFVQRSKVHAEFAQSEGHPSELAEICVFFGNQYADAAGPALAIGEQERNRYGATQTSCTYCGECDVGCNVQAKNTLDLNYLHVAEHRHGAHIRTETEVTKIVPLNAAGQPDSLADGHFGYLVCYRTVQGDSQSVRSRRVIVAAGTLGSNELLLRCRDEYGSLPRISAQLGKRFSGNGDFLAFVKPGSKSVDSNHGPVITRLTDFNLQTPPSDGQASFLLEDAGYPAFAAWYLEGLRPLFSISFVFRKLRGLEKVAWSHLFRASLRGSIVDYLRGFLQGDLSYRSSVLLFMGLDAGDGEITLRKGALSVNWPQARSMKLYQAMLDCAQRFTRFVKAPSYIQQPNWYWPLRDNITVHPLGGCALADSATQGVVDSAEGRRGQVFGYQGLYVADGALLPGPVGANPSATIAALAEWIAHDITGLQPDETLGVAHHG